MLLRSVSLQDGSHEDLESQKSFKFFVFPVSTEPQYDCGPPRVFAEYFWPELKNRAQRAANTFLFKKRPGEKIYYAIPCYTYDYATTNEGAEKFIDAFCKVLEELPIPPEAAVAVVLNPFQVGAPTEQSRGGRLSTPVVAQFFAEKFRNASRNIIWFMR